MLLRAFLPMFHSQPNYFVPNACTTQNFQGDWENALNLWTLNVFGFGEFPVWSQIKLRTPLTPEPKYLEFLLANDKSDRKFHKWIYNSSPQFIHDVPFTSKYSSCCCSANPRCSSLLVLTLSLAHYISRTKKRGKLSVFVKWGGRESNPSKSSNSLFLCTQWVKLSLTPPWENPRV